MRQITVVIPSEDVSDTLTQTPIIKSVSTIGLPGPRGPGILSNITRITASTSPPDDPEVNDLWVDIS